MLCARYRLSSDGPVREGTMSTSDRGADPVLPTPGIPFTSVESVKQVEYDGNGPDAWEILPNEGDQVVRHKEYAKITMGDCCGRMI